MEQQQTESVAQLEAKLREARKSENRQKEIDRKKYEQQRESCVQDMIFAAKAHSLAISKFKEQIHQMFDEQAIQRKQYAGGLSKASKGGFHIKSKDDTLKVTRRLASIPNWDERADEAVLLINEFLETKLKRTKAYSIIKTLISKNKAGDLSYPRVMDLIAVRDDYHDPRWVKAMELLSESYKRVYSGYAYEFHQKNSQGTWEKIELNFASVK